MTHFDQSANEWDSPGKIELIKMTAQKIKDNIELGDNLKIMDFGCGTGLLAEEFFDYAKELVGVDTSAGMLEVFDKKFADYSHAYSKNINLEHETMDQKFDLIVSSMAFHHLNDPACMVSKLMNLLEPGGRLVIVDLDEEDGTFHPDNESMGVKHFGFSKEIIEKWHPQVTHSIVHAIEKNERQYPLFLAIFQKICP